MSFLPSAQFIKEKSQVFIKAMGMGTADLIPGVSGGTIAFITGIYERFIGALSRIDHRAVQHLFRGEIKKIIDRVDLWFLLTILAGIMTAVLMLARIIDHLLEAHPEFLWSFFFGLIFASIGMVSLRIGYWKHLLLLWMTAGGIIAWSVTQTTIIQTPDTYPYIFGAGFISISAMILPGISGSYILVILDKYDFFIAVMSSISEAVQGSVAAIFTLDWARLQYAILNSRIEELLVFYAGTLTGIISFAKILNWLIRNYHDRAISLLIGFMAGSLFTVWPWRRTLETYTNRHGEEKPLVEQNVLPPFDNPDTWIAILIMIAGAVIVAGIHHISKVKKESDE